jgi:hypothetical protein
MRKKGLHLDSLVQKLFGWDLNPQIDALTERRFTIKLPKITPAPPFGIDSTGRKHGSLEESNLLASIQSFSAIGLEDRYWNRDRIISTLLHFSIARGYPLWGQL